MLSCRYIGHFFTCDLRDILGVVQKRPLRLKIVNPGLITSDQIVESQFAISSVYFMLLAHLSHTPGRIAQLVKYLTADPGVTSLIPVPYFRGD